MEEKRLFLVTYQVEAIVLAESVEHALDVACENERDIFDDASVFTEANWEASPLRHIPNGWGDDSLVYGDDEERPLKDLLLQDPDYQEWVQKRSKRSEG